MSVQATLNAISMNSVPKIKEVIANAEAFEKNQMVYKTHHEMMNSSKPVVDMTSEELEIFQDELIELFHFNNWI